MFNRTFIRILNLALSLLIFSGCQDGKKKDSPALVYREGMARCDQLAAQLKTMDVLIQGPAPTENGDEATLPTSVKSGQALVQAQAMLEDFVLVSLQLLEIGDTKVVMFPEKDRVYVGHQRAVKYLGQLYAELNWGFDAKTAVQLREVDGAELSVRQKRVATVLMALSGIGLSLDDEKAQDHIASVVKKLETSRLEPVPAWVEPVSFDALRAQELWRRNDYFQSASGQAAAAEMGDLAKSFASLKLSVQAEVSARAAVSMKLRPGRR